jgi:putative SOS response-associated peptidase YedK
MCARFTLAEPRRLAIAFPKYRFVQAERPRYNIAPTDPVPATKNDRRDTIEMLRWGLVPFWAPGPGVGVRMINARAEGIAHKRAFARAFAAQRALVWADGFYEWAGPKGYKQPYRFVVDDGGPFAFAGLWESFGDPEAPLETVTIVTTAANAVVEPIHDRMPVILDAGDLDRWLYTDDLAEAESMLVPFDPARMRRYAVSTRVSRVGYEEPDAIAPATPAANPLFPDPV